MAQRLLVGILTIILVGAVCGSASAGSALPYSLEKAERGFLVPPKAEPSSSVVAVDALIGRPLGLATTIAGTAVFVATLPFSVPSGSTREASWGLVGRPAGWTFKRPLGRSEPRYGEPSIFR